ncbi:hypothetical protein AB833_10565 [Chromatiales bacterium (ex Bugula neritina AB1)]|nr:hypothetical protein AB833_10565 [Chromatiales bacterium (ex Bugula neritina AB1)]
MGSFYANPGFTDQRVHVCVSSEIIEKQIPKPEISEYGLISKMVPVSEINKMISSGDMGDAWGITGLHYLNSYIAEMSLA